MSSRGEIVPELAALLREIAKRVEEGEADSRDDAESLRRIARTVAGEDEAFALKLHRKRRGRIPYKAVGVDRRLAMARAVKAYRDKHECSLDEAYSALDGTLDVGPDTLEDAWQEMGPLLGMSEQNLKLMLYFRKLKARGFPVKETRVKR